jgi:hypothetical protein
LAKGTLRRIARSSGTSSAIAPSMRAGTQARFESPEFNHLAMRSKAGQGRSWKDYPPDYPFGQHGDQAHPDGYDGFPGDHANNPFRPNGGPGGNAWSGGNGNGGRGGDGFGPGGNGGRGGNGAGSGRGGEGGNATQGDGNGGPGGSGGASGGEGGRGGKGHGVGGGGKGGAEATAESDRACRGSRVDRSYVRAGHRRGHVEGREPSRLSLERRTRAVPIRWEEQRGRFGFPTR